MQMKLSPSLLEGLEKCRAEVNQAFSIPPECYVVPEMAEAEEQAVFRRSWLGVGRADMVKAPGDFVTLDVAGQAVLLVRDKEGQLQALANSCRHRGARLAEGAGNCRGFKCPFHAWAYHLDGRLAAAPKMEEAAGFCREDFNLIRYRAEERLGFAFVCLDKAAPELDVVLGDFARVHAPWPMETLVSTRRREVTVDCNWKAFLEVFNEYYHLPFVHRDSIDNVYSLPDAATVTTGAYASQFGKTVGTGGLLQTQQDRALPPMPGLVGHAAQGVRYTWVFPNMTFAAGTDALWVYEAYPLGPDQCHVVQTACFPPETLELSEAASRVGAYHDRLDAALAEDIPALVNQHRGLSCPDARQGRFQPLLEPNVAAFAAWYAGTMARASNQL
ncbi:3-phenylpropionate/cinnamic acid dioxygenase subunit alpha [Roseovarius litorisediminis]|uniref:3-phenylpropionate/cinnamic acid dioxygenase subunit alpha n=1 Tax=Roseovarius litorisediminis TaxID=1312363 RepID=A0A1Y5T4Y7_9RHOB|nr:aromatic ring-hydroxylating dioxygenase subunit alpha [Roseovarius litorisediminis]SLN54255.1 3-phenylpropionate/cinnamic acid dioxygenase subunit alpha [Roseovarius litorisediminis]